jgi:hypothetical protein
MYNKTYSPKRPVIGDVLTRLQRFLGPEFGLIFSLWGGVASRRLRPSTLAFSVCITVLLSQHYKTKGDKNNVE